MCWMNSRNRGQRKVSKLVLLLVSAVANVASLAQTTSVDLNSPTLRAHAQLPKYYRGGPPLAESLTEARTNAASRGIPWKGLHFIVSDAENLAGFTSVGAVQRYQKLACQADAVIMGHTTLSAAHLSDFGTVYTDYVFVIDALLKDNRKSSLGSKPEVVVTRPGGSLQVSGDPVTFEYEGYPGLQSGITYLLFLQYIPATSAYQALDPFSTLVARGTNWLVARRSSAVPISGLTRGVLEASVGNWLTSCSK